MSRISAVLRWVSLVMATGLVAVGLTACGGGDDGKDGKDGAAGTPGTSVTSAAESLEITIDSITISSPPVVELTVRNEAGIPFAGIGSGALSFAIAKLVPRDPVTGDPSYWQNYINRTETATVGPGAGDTAVQGNRESNGTWVDHGDGTYTYTFATDISNVTSPVAVSYEPTLTHRVAIQVGGGLPVSNPIYTFRPSDGATSGIDSREIVKIETCNECHNQLALHGGGRIDTKYCVTCHNPGSTDANSGNTVDFTVMIHKIHMGEELPSVIDGTDYSIYGFRDTEHNYSDVVLPQDIRNCVKCHDGSDPDTPDGDNWKTQAGLSMQACGSCHDDVDFSKDGSDAGANDPDGHEGGIVSDNSECVTCHASGRIAGSIEESHFLAEPVAREKFKLNILKICGSDVGSNPGPLCAPGDTPTVTFSITDPTNGDAKYDITTTPEISGGNLSFLVAWDTDDYNNTDGTGARPGRADSISISGAVPAADPLTYTVTAGFIIPDGTGATAYTASGSGAVGAQGRLVGDFDGDMVYNESGSNNTRTGEQERIFVKSEVAFFRITDATVTERRPTVDNEKCNKCHDQVSFHGGSRSGEYGVCILCHHPNNTDVAQRPLVPDPGLDLKVEDSIDMKRMVHGIHAGAETLYDDSEGHGFREQGLVLYGFGGSAHDYSHVRFPGILQDCETCHEAEAYFLDGKWESPTVNGILSSTITTDGGTDPTWIDPADDLNISPTAAVCSSCHDSELAKQHMIVPGGAVFDQTQAVISSTVVETCAVCHGPGRDADVEVVHADR